MKRLSVIFLGTSFAVSLQASQTQSLTSSYQQSASFGSVASSSVGTPNNNQQAYPVRLNQENAAPTVEVESKIGTEQQEQIRQLLDTIEQLRQDAVSAIPGFNDKPTPGRFVPLLMPFDCLRPIATVYETWKRNFRAPGAQPGAQRNDEYIASATRIQAGQVTDLGQLAELPLVEADEVIVLISNKGKIFLKIDPNSEDALRGLSTDRENLLVDLYLNMYLQIIKKTHHLSEVDKAEFKQKVVRSSYSNPQKRCLCINYFGQTLADIEKQLNITPQAIPAQVVQVAAVDQAVAPNDQPRVGRFRRIGNFLWEHKGKILIGTAIVLAGGGVILITKYGAVKAGEALLVAAVGTAITKSVTN